MHIYLNMHENPMEGWKITHCFTILIKTSDTKFVILTIFK